MQAQELVHKVFGKLVVIKVEQDGNLTYRCECGRSVTRTPEELLQPTIQELTQHSKNGFLPGRMAVALSLSLLTFERSRSTFTRIGERKSATHPSWHVRGASTRRLP
jgi:hypothetical protein